MENSARHQANRGNALKSTGPKTPQGRDRSSKNALRHGLLSRNLVLPNENSDEFAELLQGLNKELCPSGLLEQSLVDRIAIAMWRQRRLVQVESAQILLRQSESSSRAVSSVVMALGDASQSDLVKIILKQPEAAFYDQALMAEIDKLESQSLAVKADFAKQFPKLWEVWCDENALEADDPDSPLPDGDALQDFLLHQLSHSEKVVEIAHKVQLVRDAQAQPDAPENMARYQSALDNDLYKAMRASREQQRYRQDARPAPVVEMAADGSLQKLPNEAKG